MREEPQAPFSGGRSALLYSLFDPSKIYIYNISTY